MQIVNFLREHWQLISFVLVVILEVVLLFVKTLKVNVKLPTNTLDQILEYVKYAEKVYGSGHGQEKLNYVVNRYLQHNDIQKVFQSEVEYWIKLLVESILESPQKKGVKDEQKK